MLQNILRIGLILALPAGIVSKSLATTATFDDLPLPADNYWNGSDQSGGFLSSGVQFANTFTDWGGGSTSWEGWAYSNKTDNTTSGYGNQYSAIAGKGANGSPNYGVAYPTISNPAIVTLSTPTTVSYAYFTNTTYAYLSMHNGDTFAKKFGGDSGNDKDWYLLTITGKDAGGVTTGTVDFYLAEFRSDDNSQDYIADSWTRVDLTGLGSNVSTIEFQLDSSDHYIDNDGFDWGMNTPGYFAMDDLTVAPEPSTLALLVIGGLAALAWRRQRNGR